MWHYFLKWKHLILCAQDDFAQQSTAKAHFQQQIQRWLSTKLLFRAAVCSNLPFPPFRIRSRMPTTDFKETVKQQADIVRIVDGYVKLKKAGAQNFSGLCPFHNEKTPSFSVHATRQFFHCFVMLCVASSMRNRCARAVCFRGKRKAVVSLQSLRSTQGRLRTIVRNSRSFVPLRITRVLRIIERTRARRMEGMGPS